MTTRISLPGSRLARAPLALGAVVVAYVAAIVGVAVVAVVFATLLAAPAQAQAQAQALSAPLAGPHAALPAAPFAGPFAAHAEGARPASTQTPTPDATTSGAGSTSSGTPAADATAAGSTGALPYCEPAGPGVPETDGTKAPTSAPAPADTPAPGASGAPTPEPTCIPVGAGTTGTGYPPRDVPDWPWITLLVTLVGGAVAWVFTRVVRAQQRTAALRRLAERP